MKIDLEINNRSKSPVSDGFLALVSSETLKELRRNIPSKNFSISVALVGRDEIRKMNKRYRNCDKETDVLSFAEYPDLSAIIREKNKALFLGELVLCYDDIEEYAGKKGIDLRKEMANVFSHGILHLFGFEHGKEMFEKQETVSEKVMEKNVK